MHMCLTNIIVLATQCRHTHTHTHLKAAPQLRLIVLKIFQFQALVILTWYNFVGWKVYKKHLTVCYYTERLPKTPLDTFTVALSPSFLTEQTWKLAKCKCARAIYLQSWKIVVLFVSRLAGIDNPAATRGGKKKQLGGQGNGMERWLPFIPGKIIIN